MERDFLGLNSFKAQLVSAKEEFVDGPKDSGFSTQNGTGKDWPYINMNKLPRHYLSFNTSQEDKNKRAPVTDSCHPNKRSTSDLQKTFNHHRPAAANFPMAAYNAHPEAHNNSQRQQSFLATNIPLSMNNPFKTHFAGLATQNLGGAAAKQPVVGAVPVAASHPTLLSAGSIAGFTEKWNNAKASGPPAKLTIFYGGTVNVFDEISPEKAQAIFFLAGTGCSMASNPNSQGSEPSPVKRQGSYLQTQPANGGATVNQNTNNASNSAISSPISVSSHTGSNNEMLQAHKLTGVLITPIHKTGTSNIRPSMSASMRQSDVPQARKASLARFLEKRKERVMNAAAPYDLFKRSSEFIP